MSDDDELQALRKRVAALESEAKAQREIVTKLAFNFNELATALIAAVGAQAGDAGADGAKAN